MADLLSLRGLVAAGASPLSPQPVRDVQAAAHAEAVTGARARTPAAAADEVRVRPAGALDLDPRDMEIRQRAVTALSSRADALERVGARLEAVRAGQPGAAAELGAAVDGMRGLVDLRPNLARALAALEPGSASALDPGVIEAALVETENALAAAFGALETERRGLAVARVAGENRASARIDLEQLEAAAERLRRLEEEAGPVQMLEALRGPAITRDRVVELLIR